jgi:hypothetical protein
MRARCYLSTLALAMTSLLAACSDDSVEPPVADTAVVNDMAPGPDQKQAPDTKPGPDIKAAADTTAPDYRPFFDGTPPACPPHTNLATKVPCMCYGTLVYNVAVQYPECQPPKEVHCCPGAQAPKCE